MVTIWSYNFIKDTGGCIFIVEKLAGKIECPKDIECSLTEKGRNLNKITKQMKLWGANWA